MIRVCVYHNSLKEMMYFFVLPSSCNLLRQCGASDVIFTTV